MYEEYIQNYLNYPINGYINSGESNGYYNYLENYEPRYDYNMVENYPYSYANSQIQELENYYPEIYNIVYPMVKKVCSQNNRGYGKEAIDSMVEEVYSNIEASDAIELNITLNNDVRGEKGEELFLDKEKNSRLETSDESKYETRQIRRNNMLKDLIRILILRELLGRPGCIGSNCRPRPRPHPGPRPYIPMRPPFQRWNLIKIWKLYKRIVTN